MKYLNGCKQRNCLCHCTVSVPSEDTLSDPPIRSTATPNLFIKVRQFCSLSSLAGSQRVDIADCWAIEFIKYKKALSKTYYPSDAHRKTKTKIL